MNNKTLIHYLQQFDPDAEVLIFDSRDNVAYPPLSPHSEYDMEQKVDLVVIPFGGRRNYYSKQTFKMGSDARYY